MFSNIYNNHRFVNPVLSDICKKSTNDYIRRLTEQNKEEKNKFNINPNLISSMVLNSDKNNDPPNSILPILTIFSFISATYFCYTFYKKD
jgi:hypothetical protein